MSSGLAMISPAAVRQPGLLFFAMEIDGRRVETSLNTLEPRARLSARELSLADVPVHVYADGERRCEVLRERRSGAIGYNNCFAFVPFEIGTDVLRQLRVYIASGEQRIYITRNGLPGRRAAGGAGRAGAAAGPAGGAGPATDPADASAATAAATAGDAAAATPPRQGAAPAR